MKKFDLYFETQGDPQGLPVVFIPPFPFSLTSWNLQRQALPSKYFGIYYDIRGFGKSPVGDGQYTMEMYVDDLRGLLDQLNIPSAVLCGLSLGGYIALRFAEKFSRHVKGLVLCNTRSEADTNDIKINRADNIKMIKTQGLEAYAEHSIPKILAQDIQVNRPELLQELKNQVCSQNPLGVCGGLLALMSRTDTTKSLSRIACPTLIIHGDEDSVILLSQAQEMHAKIPNSHMEIIPETGHLTNWENPEVFNQALIGFLEKIPVDG